MMECALCRLSCPSVIFAAVSDLNKIHGLTKILNLELQNWDSNEHGRAVVVVTTGVREE